MKDREVFYFGSTRKMNKEVYQKWQKLNAMAPMSFCMVSGLVETYSVGPDTI